MFIPVVLACLLAGRTITRDSCTVDEFGNLPLTVAYWGHDALHIDRGNPPLTRWIQGIPLLASPPELGASDAELTSIVTSWDLGYRFEAAHPDDYHAILVRARMGSLLLLLFAIVGVFGWARDLAGTRAAFAAAMLTATSPTLLAHGRLVTPDIGLAAFVVWAGWGILRARRAKGVGESVGWASAAGALAAGACLAKLTGLLLLPTLLAALLLGAGAPRERFARGGAFVFAALLPLFAAYGFPAPGAFHGIPTALPAPYVAAIEAQLAEGPYPAYLLGEVRESGGWLRYYAVATLVKTPLPTLALFALAAFVVARERREFLGPLLLAAAFAVALGLVTSKNVGIRYLLPMYPLLFVCTAAALTAAEPRVRRVADGLVVLAIVLGVGASGAPLSSFNGVEMLLGGKRAVLVDSNLDWGQGLPELREWQEREGIAVIQLAYFGRVDPSIYGLKWKTLRSEPVRGSVAISASFAVGLPYHVRMKQRAFQKESESAWASTDSWRWIRDVPPDETLAGGSLLVWTDMSAALDASRGANAEGTP